MSSMVSFNGLQIDQGKRGGQVANWSLAFNSALEKDTEKWGGQLMEQTNNRATAKSEQEF